MENYKYLSLEEELTLFEMNEVSLFLIIKRMFEIKNVLILADERLKHYRQVLFKLIRQTKRFGVNDLPAKISSRATLTSPMFESWYNHYLSWFKSLDKNTQSQIVVLARSGKDISLYLPDEGWDYSNANKIY